jgi:hypothetical protein
LPASHCRVERLEDLDFPRYQEIAQLMGWRSRIDAGTFAELAQARPNAGPNPPRPFTDWNPREAAEFEAEVAPLAKAMGYEYRVSALAEQIASPICSRYERSRISLSDLLSAVGQDR